MPSLLLPLFAVLAGVLSFSSPCALPLIPSYLSYITGMPADEIHTADTNPRLALRSSLAFVAGFTAVFTVLGASASVIGSVLIRHLPAILQVAGVFIIIMGLASMGLLRIPLLVREKRFRLSRIPQGPKGAFPLGMAFAFGWTPCIGPVLATILGIAGASGTVVTGAVLLALYSLGLGVPFVLLAFGVARARSTLGWLRRHARMVELAGGGLLVAVGLLFVSGVWKTLFVPLQARFAQLGWPPL